LKRQKFLIHNYIFVRFLMRVIDLLFFYLSKIKEGVWKKEKREKKGRKKIRNKKNSGKKKKKKSEIRKKKKPNCNNFSFYYNKCL